MLKGVVAWLITFGDTRGRRYNWPSKISKLFGKSRRSQSRRNCIWLRTVVFFATARLVNSQFVRFWRVGLGSVFLVFLFAAVLWRGGFPVIPPSAALSKVSPAVVVGYSLGWICVLLVRSVRWQSLLAPVGSVPLWRVITVSLIGYGALCLLPLRLGEAVRPTLIRQRNRIGWWEAVGTVGAERILDGLFLTATLAISLFNTRWLAPLPHHLGALPVPVALVPGATTAALTMFAILLVLLGLFYWSREFAQRIIERTVGRVSDRAAAWITSVISRTASGLSFLPMWRYLIPFFAMTVVYWVLNAALLMWLMRGCGLTSATLGQAWVAMGVLGLGVVVPNAPGYFGAFQLSLYAGLALYFRAEIVITTGAVFVFYAYIVQLGVTVLVALMAWIVNGWYSSKLALGVDTSEA